MPINFLHYKQFVQILQAILSATRKAQGIADKEKSAELVMNLSELP